jgi:type I restriction enzyme S subunit
MKRFITKFNFKKLAPSKPPLHQQEEFAQIVERFELLRSQQREAERQAKHLFQTMRHRTFLGELSPQQNDK